MTMRIRTVKPELFRHEELFDLERDTGLPIRIAWVGLIMAADREGRFRWRPKDLKCDILPYDQVDFERVLLALWSKSFLIRYVVGTDCYGLVPTFGRHQRIRSDEAASRIPPIDSGVAMEPPTFQSLGFNPSRTRHEPVPDTTRISAVELEGKGREVHTGAPESFRDETIRDQARRAYDVWVETLAAFEIPHPPGMNTAEEISLVRGIKTLGLENVMLALEGQRHEPQRDGFKPQHFLSIDRCLHRQTDGKSNWERFRNMALEHRAKPKRPRSSGSVLSDEELQAVNEKAKADRGKVSEQ